MIAMEGIDRVLVEGLSEYGEIVIPLRATEDEDVMRVDLADGRRNTFVKRLQGSVELLKPSVVGNRLIEQIVAKHGGIVTIVPGEAFPYVDGALLGAGIAE